MQAEDTLQFYGSAFQNKVLSILMKDRAFLQQVHDIIDPKYFSSESAQWLAKTTLTYFNQYKSFTNKVMRYFADVSRTLYL